jgi:hypothetical protein
MTPNDGQSVDLDALIKKLKVAREFFDALSRFELRALIQNPNLLREAFGAPRETNLADLDPGIRAQFARADSTVPAVAPAVQLTTAHGEKLRDLQIEIWRKQGIIEEMLALTHLREQARKDRSDPFADQDPESTSEKEE